MWKIVCKNHAIHDFSSIASNPADINQFRSHTGNYFNGGWLATVVCVGQRLLNLVKILENKLMGSIRNIRFMLQLFS